MLLIMVTLISCKDEHKDIKISAAVREKVENKKTAKQLKKELTSNGFEIFDFVNEKTKTPC